MLKTNAKNSQIENLTVELFRDALVDLLVEAASLKQDPKNYVIDDQVLEKFQVLMNQAKNNSGNALSDYSIIYKMVLDCSVSGAPIINLDTAKIQSADKNELLSSLQGLYNSIKMFSTSLGSPSSSLFFVG